jgi:predicted murein hydrolase (TIGR00659 family)
MELLLSIASVIVTAAVFMLSKKIYQRWSVVLFTPLLLCPIILILLLLISQTPYHQYNDGAQWLTKLLGPATVALAVPMYKHFRLLKKHGIEIFASMLIGSLTAIVSSFLFAAWMKLSPFLVNSLVPRSVTTPIAMDISELIGGTPAITAVFVIITGVLGSVIGPFLIRLISIRTSTAKGLLLGMGAHGAGASKAFEMGELEGTFASLAMVVAAIISITLASVLFPILQSNFIH